MALWYLVSPPLAALVASIALRALVRKYQVLDTSILTYERRAKRADTRAESHLWCDGASAPLVRSERDSSGTTEGHERSDMPEGDGANSPTQARTRTSGAHQRAKRLAQIHQRPTTYYFLPTTNMEKTKKLIIIGTGETAEIAYEYFTHDSAYEVVAFSVSAQYIKEPTFYGLPVVAFEEVEQLFAPQEYEAYVAISYVKLNRNRAKMYAATKEKGYTCANYVSSRAFVWHNVEMGENVFIFENNVLQHHVKLGNNIILWSGNHVGHRTVIEDHVYLSSHCVISGFCRIGAYSFLGVNSTFNDQISIGKDNVIGSGALVVKNTEDGKLMMGAPAKPASKTAYEAFGVAENEI